EADDLVAPGLGADEAGVGLVMREQPILIGGPAGEVGFRLRPLDRRALGAEARALRVQMRLALVVERLVADRIPSRIGAEVDVPGPLHAPPDLLHGGVVRRFGRADE